MISIVPYERHWPSEYVQLATALQLALGSLALRIDHIGSTAVPGLVAKNVIDIQVTVAGFSQALEDALGAVGYTRRTDITHDHAPPQWSGPPDAWEKWYFHPPANQRSTHLHVRVAGRPNQRYALLFRDYLRAHPAAATTTIFGAIISATPPRAWCSCDRRERSHMARWRCSRMCMGTCGTW